MGTPNRPESTDGSRRVLWSAATGSILMMVVLAGCSGGNQTRDEVEPRVIPTNGAQPVHVLSSQVFASVMGPLESAFEREHPEFDLVVTYGVERAPLDADQDLQTIIGDGAQADVFLAGDLRQVEEVSRAPMSIVPWLGNRLVLVRRSRSRLRMIDLSKGNCEVAVALERTPLGRASRAALEARGIWSGISERVGLFGDGETILSRTGSLGLDPVLGIVYASTRLNSELPIEVAGVIADEDLVDQHVVSVWSEDGGRFAEWLISPAAQRIASQSGFLALYSVEVDEDAETGARR